MGKWRGELRKAAFSPRQPPLTAAAIFEKEKTLGRRLGNVEHAAQKVQGLLERKRRETALWKRRNQQQTTVSDDRFKEQLLCKLDELRKANFLCDTIVRVEGEDFPAHKNVLCATSDYFKAFFSSDLQVKESQGSLVELKNMKSSTIAEVLRHNRSGRRRRFSRSQECSMCHKRLL